MDGGGKRRQVAEVGVNLVPSTPGECRVATSLADAADYAMIERSPACALPAFEDPQCLV